MNELPAGYQIIEIRGIPLGEDDPMEAPMFIAAYLAPFCPLVGPLVTLASVPPVERVYRGAVLLVDPTRFTRIQRKRGSFHHRG